MSHDNEQISYEDYCKEIDEFEKGKKKKEKFELALTNDKNPKIIAEVKGDNEVIGNILADSVSDILDWIFKGKKKNYRSDKW